MESAASCSPAIHPSVRRSSDATSAADRRTSITCSRKAAASSAVKRRSAARSSVKWPRARSRAKGSERVLARSQNEMHVWRQVFQQEVDRFVCGAGLDRVVIVQHEKEVGPLR